MRHDIDKTAFRLAAALCAALGVAAGTQAGDARAEDAHPDMETQTYGTWTMRCTRQADAVPPCDIVQAVTNRDTGKQVMQVSFAYLADKGQYAVQLLLPLGFLIPPGVLVRIDGAPDITDWPVVRCEPQGCFVERLLAAEALAPFRDHDKGTVVVLDPQGKPLGFPLALGGFAAAADAMTARDKTPPKGK